MKQLIEYIVSNIVNHPESVVINETAIDESLTKYSIKVDPEDVGRVIGKQGKVIKAIRQIIRISAIQKGVRIIVDLEDEGRPDTTDDEYSSTETEEKTPSEETIKADATEEVEKITKKEVAEETQAE